MQLEVGKIYEGKVTGITKFGAFVELDKDTTGMVHISEVANTFVNEIKDHIQEGQTVKVKVLSLGEDNKISLSIKRALPAPPRKQKDNGSQRGGQSRQNNQGRSGAFQKHGTPRNKDFDREPQDFSKNPPPVYDPKAASGNADFEDMLSRFKSASEERFSDLKHVMDNKRRSASRRR
ncbi:S1 RNA-binding domain-containing protein [Ruminococcus sp. Marseille-P6503]|uniref:S1 RNA-binding domain-containing protein n=1 Tax=Ruminococcus sp. Marseille-P6503 TaxID=2364796 RepID=UPI000F54C531|nr:S1 RNA-binding domain-containing protein [Ruminococcus sp. Marseille-P6503]